MRDSVKKYADKENYIVPLTIEDREGFLLTQVYAENKQYITGKDLLHIGCNNGASTFHLARLNPKKMEGVDVNAVAIGEARKLLPDIKFHVASAHDLHGISDNSFDSILMFETLEHLYDDDKSPAVSEFSRVLRPGGVIILSVPRAFRDRAKRNPMAHDPHHECFYYEEGDLHKEFKGWRCVKIYHETRPNPNNKAHHNSWVAIYKNPA
jgi:ubiquinone/menaquinone biosynthesis C-methylase UbiE